jgi:hypothetical protein
MDRHQSLLKVESSYELRRGGEKAASQARGGQLLRAAAVKLSGEGVHVVTGRVPGEEGEVTSEPVVCRLSSCSRLSARCKDAVEEEGP